MQRVIDSNYLQDPALRIYLGKGARNFAVLPDYIAIEAYKDDTLRSIYKSMEILCEFPEQVIVLKSTMVIGKLSGRSAGLVRRMIDRKETKAFPKFCQNLARAKAGNPAIERQILKHGREADMQMERILSDAAIFNEIYADVSRMFTPDEIRHFRVGTGSYTPDMVIKSMDFVTAVAIRLMQHHPHGVRTPTYGELPNMFIFRASLCHFIGFLRWLREGGQADTKPGKVRNDLVDTILATYATYFNGIFSHDKRLRNLFGEANFLLGLIKKNVESRKRARAISLNAESGWGFR